MIQIKKDFAAVALLMFLGAGCETTQLPVTQKVPDQIPVERSLAPSVVPNQKVITPSVVAPKLKPQQVPQSITAPNGTYKNVDGTNVPSPYAAPSAPAGATAQCRDGTYSFSQHRSGTCSHHDGVAEWF